MGIQINRWIFHIAQVWTFIRINTIILRSCLGQLPPRRIAVGDRIVTNVYATENEVLAYAVVIYNSSAS